MNGTWWYAIRAIVVLMAAACGAAGETPQPDAAGVQFFQTRVQPILQANCFKCHGGQKIRSNLVLTARDGILQGGDHGPAVDLQRPDQSLLLKMISYADDEHQMPPSGKLAPDDIAILTQWVTMGLPWPEGVDFTRAQREHKPDLKAVARTHWAFQPVQRPTPPAVANAAWVRSDIDRFVLARLEAAGLKPAPEADRTTLIRRATYDLTGLPPTPEAVDAFIRDTAPDAYERLVERLLASPHYGEKWGRFWLDLVRYGETNSYERDNPKPHVWRYRDYVIRAFNADKPYDRFMLEQLAGDELPDADNDAWIATGYYRLGIWDDEPADRKQARYDMLDDIVTTTGEVFMGLTVGCARCHDHKIDPLPQADYYRLLSFVHNINHFNNGGPTDEKALFVDAQAAATFERAQADRQQELEQVQAEIKSLEADARSRMIAGEGRGIDPKLDELDPKRHGELVRLIESRRGVAVLGADRVDRYKQLRKRIGELRQPVPADRALVVTERGRAAPDTFVLIRGSAHAEGEKVEPGFPQVLGETAVHIPDLGPDAKTSGRRLALARWLVSPDHPLTARVMVNRIWQQHMGRGLVRSASNFGLQGDKPTHPLLLDHLAGEFIAHGWRLKPLHRAIMLSATYRMSSEPDRDALAKDPTNDLLWRFDMRRLTAEEIRDSILAVTGTLNPAMFGPSVYPPIPREVLAGQSRPGHGWPVSSPEASARRSIYIHVKRSLRVPIIEAFDAPESDFSCPVRMETTQPTQALGMINGEFMQQQAALLAERLEREAGGDAAAKVRRALRLVTGRAPSEQEVERGVKLVADLMTTDGASPEQALRALCLVALNLNEFVYLD